MNCFTILIFCVTIALASARPQFGNDRIQQNQNFPNPLNPWLNPTSDFSNQFSNNFGNQNPPNLFESFEPNPNNPFLPNPITNSGMNRQNQGTLDQFVQPQQQQNQQRQENQNQSQLSGNENTTGASVNTAIAQLKTSSQYVECNTGCIVLSEYNPVCGSDNVTYMNERKLECANNCGRRLTPNWEVITSRRGACSTAPRVP